MSFGLGANVVDIVDDDDDGDDDHDYTKMQQIPLTATWCNVQNGDLEPA